MFTLTQVFLGIVLPTPTFPIDSIGDAYSFEDVRVLSTQSDEELDVDGVSAAITFAGDPFPLQGADYLAAVTGTLMVTVTQSLAQGLYRFPFVSQQYLNPVTGLALHGHLGLGTKSLIRQQIQAAILVQSFTIPTITFPRQGGRVTVPTVTP